MQSVLLPRLFGIGDNVLDTFAAKCCFHCGFQQRFSVVSRSATTPWMPGRRLYLHHPADTVPVAFIALGKVLQENPSGCKQPGIPDAFPLVPAKAFYLLFQSLMLFFQCIFPAVYPVKFFLQFFCPVSSSFSVLPERTHRF